MMNFKKPNDGTNELLLQSLMVVYSFHLVFVAIEHLILRLFTYIANPVFSKNEENTGIRHNLTLSKLLLIYKLSFTNRTENYAI